LRERALATESSEDPNHSGTDWDTLYLFGGAALILFGSGLILSNPIVRRHLGLGQVGADGLIQSAFADIERYFKSRAM
jgi:hypothetical protein